jgi:hypothetical protein
MLKFTLIIALLLGAYFVVRYFIKNKAAREGLVNQVEADVSKVKKDLTKIVKKAQENKK